MSTRAKIAAAAASLGVLGLGWNAATAGGQTLTPSGGTTTPTSTTQPTTTSGTAPSGSATTTTPKATSAASTTASYADGTYTGATATHRYGSVTVTVTITNGQIAGLTQRVVSDGDRKSEQINTRAVPTLRDRILAAHSAGVSTVSGATYTTGAYLTSLQSALDQAAR